MLVLEQNNLAVPVEMDLSRAEIILKVLENVRFATARQLSEMMPPSPNAKRILINKYAADGVTVLKTHEYHDSYDDVIKTLQRMLKHGVVKCTKIGNRWDANLWSLPSVKEPSPEFRDHELGLTDLHNA